MDFAKMMEQMKAAGVGGPEGAEGEGEADSSDDEGVSPVPPTVSLCKLHRADSSLACCPQPPPLEQA